MSHLRIEGEVETPLDLGYEDLRSMTDQIEDVSRVVPGRVGSGVTLAAVLSRAGISPSARAVYLESADGTFQATLKLEDVRHAVLAYRYEGGPLPETKGGPVRFLTPHDGDCDKTDGHACANVKDLGLVRVLREL